MLEINVPAKELFDEENNLFINVKATTLCLEHSLISISKWESKWKTPFISKDSKTNEQLRDYIKCMTINQVDPMTYYALTDSNFKAVNDYISDSMTATWFNEDKRSSRKEEIITSELIYYWMIALNIPMECQKWHLNRLITLIRVCSIKNQPEKQMKKSDIYANNAALNAARRKALRTKG